MANLRASDHPSPQGRWILCETNSSTVGLDDGICLVMGSIKGKCREIAPGFVDNKVAAPLLLSQFWVFFVQR